MWAAKLSKSSTKDCTLACGPQTSTKKEQTTVITPKPRFKVTRVSLRVAIGFCRIICLLGFVYRHSRALWEGFAGPCEVRDLKIVAVCLHLSLFTTYWLTRQTDLLSNRPYCGNQVHRAVDVNMASPDSRAGKTIIPQTSYGRNYHERMHWLTVGIAFSQQILR